jgi:D-xylose transport system substrate-binding protein
MGVTAVSFIRRYVVAVVALAVTVGAAGCGPASDAGDDGRKKIAFLLPDVGATRYDRFDVPYFATKVEQLCGTCEIIYRNAAQLTKTQEFQAEEALDNGADVLVLDPVDAKEGAKIAKRAKDRDVPVISYDRLTEGPDIDYYISFDNEKVGRQQATSLLERLRATGTTAGKIVMINGSETDNNAKQFNRGAHSIFDKSGFELTPAEDFFTPDWEPPRAQEFMAAQLKTLRKPGTSDSTPQNLGFVAVYAANDGTAGGAIEAMSAAGIKPLPPVTGQDAELPAIQRILLGEQYMTVFKNYRPEAERAAEYAVALVNGERPQAPNKVNNGTKDVPSLLLDPTVVTLENLKTTIIETGLYTIEEVCTEQFVDGCRTAGLGT